MTIHWKAVEQYFTVVLFVFTQFVILDNLSIYDLALSGVKGLIDLINPLRPGIKLHILLLCFHTFLTEVVGRSC